MKRQFVIAIVAAVALLSIGPAPAQPKLTVEQVVNVFTGLSQLDGHQTGVDKDGKPEPGRSEAEVARIRKQVAEDIKQEATKSRGTVPAGWARWADEQLSPPKVPWRQKLARQARAAVQFQKGMVDYTYSRPSRRQASHGYGIGKPILPTLHAPVPRVAVGVDTSGSMGQHELDQALRETNGVLMAVGAEVEFVACDAEVHVQKKVRNWKDVRANLKGGGGTDFRPVFEAFDKAKPRPDIVIFVTDGYGPAPVEAPANMKVIWLLVGGNEQAPATWGECIPMKD